MFIIYEEINRVLTDHVSKYLFCPSKLATNNLKKENITEGVYFTGDIMYDLFLKMKPHFDENIIKKFDLEENKYILTTIHRDFNTDSKSNLEAILKELDKISKEIKVIFPIHPRTKKRIEEFDLKQYTKNILMIEPLDYLSMMGLRRITKRSVLCRKKSNSCYARYRLERINRCRLEYTKPTL